MPNSPNRYECEHCQDREGFIIRTPRIIYLPDGTERTVHDEVWRWCEKCHEKKRIQRLFKFSQITEEFQKISFHGFEYENRPAPVAEAYWTALRYLTHFQDIRRSRKNSIALLGSPGSGKTHLLTAIANRLMFDGVGVLYFPWVEGFNELKTDMSLLDSRIQHMQTVSVLFIDDLFKGRKEPTPFQLEQFFAIVNYRYLNHLPMLVSSEKDIDQICDFDEGIGSRIYEMCKNNIVTLKGAKGLNYRLRNEAI